MIYRSNLVCPDLTLCFKHTFTTRGPWGHDVLHDKDFDRHCGFATHDEAAILYHAAKRIGGYWVEIGSHTGWSGAHLRMGAANVMLVEPDLALHERLSENLFRAPDSKANWLVAGLTSEKFWGSEHAHHETAGLFIDGNHDEPEPTNDARWALPFLAETAVVIFHDAYGEPIKNGVRFLMDHGFHAKPYYTPNGMVICWRGDYEPPHHEPDPRILNDKRRETLCLTPVRS